MVAVFSLAALGALGMGFTTNPSARAPQLAKQPAVALRAFPSGAVGAAVVAPPTTPVAAVKPGDDKPAEVAAKPEEKPAEPPKPAEVAAKPAEVAAKPAEVAAKPAETPKPAEKPVEVAARPPAENKPPAEKPVEAAKPPAEGAENKPPPAAKPPAAEGLLNLRASDTADVYLDGKKLGGSPLLGVKAKAGNHKVRFDCYDAAGNTVAGPVQVVSVKADAEVEVEFSCPTE